MMATRWYKDATWVNCDGLSDVWVDSNAAKYTNHMLNFCSIFLKGGTKASVFMKGENFLQDSMRITVCIYPPLPPPRKYWYLRFKSSV